MLILPNVFGAEDYRIILAHFDLDQIVERRARICRLQMRRLTCENKKSVLNCNAIALELLQFHNIPRHIKELEESVDNMNKESWNVKLNMIDEEVIGILLHAEKKCRKL